MASAPSSLPIGTTERLSVLRLFAAGYDTSDIAKFYGISEAQAHEQLSRERSAALGLPDPYPKNSLPAVREAHRWPSGRVAYAGREY